MRFRRKLTMDYRRERGRAIDPQAVLDNARRAGYRLNPKTVVVKP